MSLRIRLVTLEDAEALCRLNDLFNGPGTVPADVSSYLKTDHREIIAVAQQDDAVIGFACAQVLFTFYEIQPIAEIGTGVLRPSSWSFWRITAPNNSTFPILSC